jgi:hypothetical protein
MTTIAISTTSVITHMRAIAALRCHYRRQDTSPMAMLSDDRDPALRDIIDNAIHATATALGGSAPVTDSQGDIHRFSLTAASIAISHTIEQAIALRTLATAADDTATAATLNTMADKAIDDALRDIAASATRGTITPQPW